MVIFNKKWILIANYYNNTTKMYLFGEISSTHFWLKMRIIDVEIANLKKEIFDLSFQLREEKDKNLKLTKKQECIDIDILELKENMYLPADFGIIEQDWEVSVCQSFLWI